MKIILLWLGKNNNFFFILFAKTFYLLVYKIIKYIIHCTFMYLRYRTLKDSLLLAILILTMGQFYLFKSINDIS